MSDAEAVAADKAALDVSYGAGDSASSVTQNVTLATSGANGSSINWSSSSTGVITNSGTVTRPTYTAGDAAVTLTATISIGAVSDTKVFNLTVKALPMSDTEAVAVGKTALNVGYGAGDSASNVTQNVTLATGGANGSSIGWSSNNTGVITNTGTVNRPAYGSGDATVTLTATISKGSTSDTKVFTLVVKEQAQTDAQAVAADKAALDVGYGTGDSASSVTQNVSLATGGASGSTINWSSNNTGIITNSGTVNRPSYTAGDASVTLTATISKGSASDTKVFTLVVKEQAQTDAQAVAADKTALVISYGAGDNASNVTQNLTLATSGTNSSSISWSSNNIGVITNIGTVTRPTYTAGNAAVTLTATISKGSASDTKVFNLTVKALPMSDTEAVEADKAALNITYAAGDNASNVTQNLTLAAGGSNGTSISWASSNLAVITSSGTVKRPSYTNGDAAVTLRATIKKGNYSSTKLFFLTVKALPMNDTEAVAADKAALTIPFSGTDTAGSITQALGPLPAAGANGSGITWASSDTSILSNDGQTVIRPTYTIGNVTVTLTATISRGGVSDKKVFNLTLKALPMNDGEAVDLDKAALNLTYSGTDKASSVTQALGALPAAGANGTTITWASGNTAILSNDGQKVNRPSYTTGDTEVIMTATISKGAASDTKVFTLMVKALPMSNAEAVAAAKAALEIGYGVGDSASKVTQNVTLPTGGANGASISWSSGNTAVLANNGVVRRPTYTIGDKEIALTAAISKGTASDTKTFTLTVKALSMNDAEAVALDKSTLGIIFNGTDTASSVSQALGALPTAGANGTGITWFSSHSALVDNTGQVVRPNRSTGDVKVTLTANISKGLALEKKQFAFKVLADQDDPTIVNVNPAPGATNIEKGVLVNIKFSEPVYKGSSLYQIQLNEVRTETRRTWLGGITTTEKRVKVLTVLSIDGDTITVRPANNLESYSLYEIVIPADAVRDRSGNSLQCPRVRYDGKFQNVRVSSFRTGINIEPPKVVNVFPAQNAEGIALNTQISVTFDKPIKGGPAFDGITLTDSGGNKISFVKEISWGTLTIRPDSLLKNGTKYQLKVPARSVTTQSGTDLSEQLLFGFTTGRFEVVSQPENGEINVPVNGAVIIKFDGDIQPGSNLGAITVKDPDNNNVVINSIVNDGILLIRPAGNLDFGTKYKVNVPSGAVSGADGNIFGEYIFSFTTAEEITYTLPGFNYTPVAQIEGDPVDFNATHVILRAAQDYGRKVIEHSWDFGDGGSDLGADLGESVSHTYDSAGTYTVTLKLTDDKGQSYSISNVVLIKSLDDITMIVSPDGTLKYNHVTDLSDLWNDVEHGPEFTVSLDTDGVPLSGKPVTIYNGSKKIKDVATGRYGEVTFKVDQDSLDWGDNILTFAAYGHEVQRMIRKEAGHSNYKIAVRNSTSVDGVRFWVDGQEKTAMLSNGFYELGSISSGYHWIKISAPYYYDKEFTRDFYRNAESDVVELEPKTPGGKPVVRWVISDYTDSRNGKSDFIQGAELTTTLAAEVDWKGHKPGYVRFVTPDRTYRETSGKRSLDLGSDIRVGGRVTVVAVSAFSVESAAVDAGIRILPKPPVGDVTFNKETREYEFSMIESLPSAKSPNAPSSLPFFAGNSLGFDSDNFALSGTMDKKGNLVMTIAAGGGKEKTKKRLLKAPKKEYKVDVGGVSIEGFLGAEYTYAYRDNTKDWAFKGGKITVQVNGTATKKQYFLIPVIFVPGYVRGTIGVNTETGLEITKDFTNNTTKYQGVVMIGPNAEIAIGAGGGEFTVEGYLNGEADFQYTFPDNELSVEAELNGGVRAQAWIFSWEDNLLHYEWEYAKKSSSSLRLMSTDEGSKPIVLVPKDAEFKPSSRAYLVNGSTWQAPAGDGVSGAEPGKMSPMSVAEGAAAPSGDISAIVMQSSIFPYPEPVMADSGSDTVLAWVADNPERSGINRTELSFSKFNGTGWSAPSFMSLDNTADFSPHLAGTSNGILAVWENVYEELPETAALPDMSAGMEIAAARSDGDISNWTGFANLTSNNYLDHAPRLAASGDSAILLWTSNRANDLTGSAANPNEILFSKWNGTAWSEPSVVLNNLGAVTYTMAAYNGSEGAFAYVADGDDDTSTTEDQELYVITYDGSNWSSPVRVTNNQVQDANPQITYINNQLFTVWYQDGNPVYTIGLQGSPSTIAGIAGANADFKMTRYGADRLALVYTQPSAGKGQDIYTSFYDADADSWSNPIQLTSQEDYLNSALGPVFDQAGNLMVAHSKSELITNEVNGMKYSNPGQTALGMVTFKPKHDLSVSAEGIQFSQDNPVPGTKVTITADIRNEGDFPEEAVEVDFYNGNPAAGGTKISATQVVQDVIPARGSTSVSVEWTVPTGAGPHRVYVVVDPQDKAHDSSMDNNNAYIDAVAPDIEIEDLRYEPLGGTQYLITADIANIGSMDVGASEINLYDGENEDTLVATEQVEALESGTQTQAVFIWDAAGKEFVNNEFRLSTRLNAPAGVSEYTEENNIYKLALSMDPLYAESFSPALNSRTAPVDQGITIKLNTDIQPGPTYEEIALLDEGGNTVSIGKEIAGSVLTITPSASLEYEKTYTFSLKKGDITGLNGSDLESEFVLDFTTDVLHTNPVVSFAYPADEMEGASLNDNINIMFNEAVTAGSNFSSIKLTDSYGWAVAAETELSGSTLVINPAYNLQYGTQYTVTIPAGAVLNNSGKPLEAAYSFTFTTLPNPDAGSSSDDSVSPSTVKPAQSERELVLTDLVTEDGLKVVVVEKQLTEKAGSVRQAAAGLGAEMLVDPVEFKIEAQTKDGATKSIPNFNNYVPRSITLKATVDPAKTTGVIYNPETGKFLPVPTVFKTVDGKQVATIKHQGSGIYTVISTEKTFNDIQNHWAKKDVETLASKLIVSGKGEDLYDPQGKVTRAEFATLLVRAMGLTEPGPTQQRFADVSGQWFADSVNKAAAAGLISGYTDATFRPNANITREEMAAMVTRALALAGSDFQVNEADNLLTRFGDSGEIQDWSKAAVAKAVQAGIVNGNKKAEFLPGVKASRAEAVVMIMRTLNYVGFVNG